MTIPFQNQVENQRQETSTKLQKYVTKWKQKWKNKSKWQNKFFFELLNFIKRRAQKDQEKLSNPKPNNSEFQAKTSKTLQIL